MNTQSPIPARLMRPQAEASPHRPRPTERQRQRRAYILDAATRIFTTHGRLRTTLREFATAIGLSQHVIRNEIADMDHLFALVLAKHLDTILHAIGAVPLHHPDLQARRRAEYFRVTRGFMGVPTPLHFLWLRERYTLPEDQLEPLEQTIGLIGSMLGGQAWQTALLLLDSPHLDETQIEAMLEAHARTAQPEAPIAEAPSAEAPENSETPNAPPARPIFPARQFTSTPPRTGQPPPPAQRKAA